MGDLLRRILYPMVLPLIVGSLWVHAWSKRFEGQAMSDTMKPDMAATALAYQDAVSLGYEHTPDPDPAPDSAPEPVPNPASDHAVALTDVR